MVYHNNTAESQSIVDSTSISASSNFEELVKMLTIQQFYTGGDRIINRIKSQQIKIKNSGLVILRLQQLLITPCNYLINGNVKKYLNELKTFFPELEDEKNIQDIISKIPDIEIKIDDESKNEINQKKKNDKENDKKSECRKLSKDELYLSMNVISSLLNYPRMAAHKKLKNLLREKIKKKYENLKDEQIEKIIERWGAENNDDYWILENLLYLDNLAERLHFKKVVHIVRIQIGRRTFRLLKTIT